MAKYGMIIDVTKCTGCYNCFLACKDEHCEHDYPEYTAAQPMTGHYWMRLIEQERGKYPKVKVAYIPVTCMHCQDAMCVKSAQGRAVYRRPDGIVIIDPVKAQGQKQLISSCPYRVIYWNEKLQLPQKCTLCAHLLNQGWKEPRCVESCPTGALVFGDLDDPNSEIAKLISSGVTEVLHPEYALGEKVVYIGIPKKFISGTIAYGDTDECAGDVIVTLSGNGGDKTATTNNFGDFEFEGLPDNMEYKLKVKAPGYEPLDLQVKTMTDIYLGVLMLNKQA